MFEPFFPFRPQKLTSLGMLFCVAEAAGTEHIESRVAYPVRVSDGICIHLFHFMGTLGHKISNQQKKNSTKELCTLVSSTLRTRVAFEAMIPYMIL